MQTLLDAGELWVTGIAGALGLLALVVAVRAPSWDRLQRWASRHSPVVADTEVTAARALLTRTDLVTLVTFALLTPLTLAVQLKAAGPALALATAVVVGAGTSVDGGRTRRASLATGGPEAMSRPALFLSVWPVAVACLALVLWWFANSRSGPLGFNGVGVGTAMPDLNRWMLPVLAVASLVHAGALIVVLRRVHRRRAVPGVSSGLDASLRALQQRRAVTGAFTGNLVLTAALANAAPLLALPDWPEPELVRWVGLAATAVVGVTLAFLAVRLVRWGAGVDHHSPTPSAPSTPSPLSQAASQAADSPAVDCAAACRSGDDAGRAG